MRQIRTSTLWLGSVALVALTCCGGLFWFLNHEPVRFRHRFELGGGHTLTVESRQRSELDDPLDPNPYLVYYRVDAGWRPVVPTTMLEYDDGGAYNFRFVQTADGRLSYIFKVNRATMPSYLFLVFDADSGESWPRLLDHETRTEPHVIKKWQQRYSRLLSEHADLPSPRQVFTP